MKVAISLCPNDIFVYAALILKEVKNTIDFSVHPLGDLNTKIGENKFDFIKVSSSVLMETRSYKLTRVGASLAREKGPQLVRASGNPEVSGDILGVPSLSATATRLARRYYPHLKPKEFPLGKLCPLVAAGEIPFAIVINEDMNRLSELGVESICDLGLRWNEEFSAFLPLGVVGGKADLSTGETEYFENLVDASLKWGRENPDRAIGLSREYTGNVAINRKHIDLFTQDAGLNSWVSEYYEKFVQSIQ